MSRRLIPLLAVVMLIGGCATSHWQSTKPHLTIAVAPVVNPIAQQSRFGVTVFGNKFVPVDMGFDINGEIDSVMRKNLGKSQRYTLADLPVDPKVFSAATTTWNSGLSVSFLPKPLADQLVQAAQGRGIDYIIAVIDVRGPGGGTKEWGLYQHHSLKGCIDAYISYFVFVLDANTGETVASESHVGFRRIENGIDWDEDWSAIPDAKRQEIFDDLRSIVREDIPRTLTRMGVIPSSDFAKYPDPYECTPL